MNPAITVIIPALNEAAHIGRALDSLCVQKFTAGFEVIVVDNGSSDETIEIARFHASRLQITILQRTKVRISALRNAGAAAAKAPVLAFLDADCAASPDWLCNIERRIAVESETVIGAPYLVPLHFSWVAVTWYSHEQARCSGPVSYLPGGDMILSARAFRRIGGFDETIETNEDYEFCQRAAANGMKLLAYPDLAVFHWGTPQTLKAFYRKQRWHGKHVLKVFLRDASKRRNLRAVAYAFFFAYLLGGLLIGVLAGLVWGRWSLCMMVLSALLAAPFLLALRQLRNKGRWQFLFPLALLFAVYGVARAMCLVGPGSRRDRSDGGS